MECVVGVVTWRGYRSSLGVRRGVGWEREERHQILGRFCFDLALLLFQQETAKPGTVAVQQVQTCERGAGTRCLTPMVIFRKRREVHACLGLNLNSIESWSCWRGSGVA
jgi:hypothetical protein